MISSLFTPFSLGRRFSVKFLAAGQLVILAALWFAAPASIGFPAPLDILSEWNRLTLHDGLLVELGHSALVIAEAIVLSSIIALSLAYLSTADIFKAAGSLTSALRFLGFAGLTYLFTLWTSNGHQLKLSLLTFGMTVFLARSAIDVVRSTTTADVDYGRSLGLSGWRLTWELIVRGRMPDMLELIRQNAAVGWTLLAMVEGITRSEGGIGSMLLNQNKAFNLSAVFAIQLTILSYGIIQDWGLSWLRHALCPWTHLNSTRT